MCRILGAYIRIEDFNGGGWLVGLDLGGPTAFLRNISKSAAVPTSGWQYWQYSYGGGCWWPAPADPPPRPLHYPLRQRHRLGLPPLILTTARIFWRGRQVFQTTTGWVLSASNGGRGVVCDGEGEARLLIVN